MKQLLFLDAENRVERYLDQAQWTSVLDFIETLPPRLSESHPPFGKYFSYRANRSCWANCSGTAHKGGTAAIARIGGPIHEIVCAHLSSEAQSQALIPPKEDSAPRSTRSDCRRGGAALVERRFRDGISAGDIPSDFPVATRAIQVTDLARGLTMRAQLGTPRKTLLKDAEEAADLVLLPPRV
jgi:hypothetical protein